jgi:iron complex outermembrane receptor protein
MARARSTIATTDFSFQHTFGLGERNDVIWGLGYRHMGGSLEQTNPFAQVRDRDFGLQLFSAFVQDELQVVPEKLSVTLGTKLEHNDFTGCEIQPSLRTVFKPTADQSAWAAVSRAVRTPDVVEGGTALAIASGAPFPGPGGVYVPMLVGNPALDSDVQWSFEIGYRAQISKRVSMELTAFRNNYSRLITYGGVTRLIPGSPVGMAEIPWTNLTSGHTDGGEIVATVAPLDTWRLSASYSRLITRLRPAGPDGTLPDESSPKHQAMLRSSWDVSKRESLDAQLRYVGEIAGVPAYVTADVRFSYRVTDQLDLSIVGKNLLDRRHPEQANVAFATVAEVPRSLMGKVTWRF